MLYRVAADAVVLMHVLFIVFALFGGLLAIRWRWLIALHLPAVAWGAAVEVFHLYCPLTPLENGLRVKAGDQGFSGGFIEHYLIPLIYPAGLTPQTQLWLGAGVVVINGVVYFCVIRRHRRQRNAL